MQNTRFRASLWGNIEIEGSREIGGDFAYRNNLFIFGEVVRGDLLEVTSE